MNDINTDSVGRFINSVLRMYDIPIEKNQNLNCNKREEIANTLKSLQRKWI